MGCFVSDLVRNLICWLSQAKAHLSLISLLPNSFKLSKEEERKRQEKLARERIEAARQGCSQGRQLDDDSLAVVDTDDPASLQEAIARDLDRRHRKEMEFFMQVGFIKWYIPCKVPDNGSIVML